MGFRAFLLAIVAYRQVWTVGVRLGQWALDWAKSPTSELRESDVRHVVEVERLVLALVLILTLSNVSSPTGKYIYEY